ncbi:MAG TPA: SH3 domain-containing protein [Anaerolineales bacterium]
MLHKSILTFALLTSVFLAGCSVPVQTGIPETSAPVIITATLPPVPTPRPSQTPFAPLPSPTVVPFWGTTSTQLNVRVDPSTASDVLGIIAANVVVQIVGQDPGGNWWQIMYNAGIEGKGWVTAQYIETATKPEVPVIGDVGTSPDSGHSAVVIQQLNVRSGPSTSFDLVGILNPNDVVELTGKNRDGAWLQIEFTNGVGWINAMFVKADALDILPIVSDLGEVVGTGTPMANPPPPTSTLVPASMDFDTADAPLKTILFEWTGTQTLIFSGDVSAPEGDTEDWIAFTPYDNFVFVSVQCAGSSSLRVEVFGSGSSLICSEAAQVVSVQAGVLQLILIKAIPTPGVLQYTNYILTIKARR